MYCRYCGAEAKKSKCLMVVFIVLVLAITMVSCVDVTATITINNNGGGKIVAVIEMSKSVYDTISSLDESSSFDFEDENVKKEYFDKDGEKYIRFSQEEVYKSYDELEKGALELFLSRFSISKNEESKEITVKGKVNLTDEELSYYSSINLIIEMPGDIKTIDGCVEKTEKDNVVKVDLLSIDENSKTSFKIVSKNGGTSLLEILIIVISLIAVALLITISIIKILKKKDKKSTIDENQLEGDVSNDVIESGNGAISDCEE